jgi:hypothetical protein
VAVIVLSGSEFPLSSFFCLPLTTFHLPLILFVEYYTQVRNGFVVYNPLCFENRLRSSSLELPKQL